MRKVNEMTHALVLNEVFNTTMITTFDRPAIKVSICDSCAAQRSCELDDGNIIIHCSQYSTKKQSYHNN